MITYTSLIYNFKIKIFNFYLLFLFNYICFITNDKNYMNFEAPLKLGAYWKIVIWFLNSKTTIFLLKIT